MGYYEEDYYEEDYYEEDYEDDHDSGCGEGWSCSNCPILGCPANEFN